MKPKMLFLINPNAGHTGIRTGLLDVLALFSEKYEVRVHTTTHPREITEVIALEGSRYDTVVSCGGDGTMNETVTGVIALPEEERPVIGYIPAGTCNDVGASLGLSTNVLQAAKDIVNGTVFPLDIGTFNGRPYTYVAAFGAFTAVPYETPQSSKHALGRLAYLLEGARTLGEIRPIHVKITSEEYTVEDDFLLGMLCSTTSVGGFRAKNLANLDVSLNDGLSEAVFVRNIPDIAAFGEILAELGRMDITDPAHFLTFQTKEIRVETEHPVAWTVDGEDGGQCSSACLRNVPQAVRILVPARTE